MRRFSYFVILGLAVYDVWLWQGESIQRMMGDNVSPNTNDGSEGESETQRPLTPEERSDYIAAVNQALREKMVVYKGRLRLYGFGGPLFGVDYVPIPLISVHCGPNS